MEKELGGEEVLVEVALSGVFRPQDKTESAVCWRMVPLGPVPAGREVRLSEFIISREVWKSRE